MSRQSLSPARGIACELRDGVGSSMSLAVLKPQVFFSLLLHVIFYRFIVKRLRPLFVGDAIQIAFD